MMQFKKYTICMIIALVLLMLEYRVGSFFLFANIIGYCLLLYGIKQYEENVVEKKQLCMLMIVYLILCVIGYFTLSQNKIVSWGLTIVAKTIDLIVFYQWCSMIYQQTKQERMLSQRKLILMCATMGVVAQCLYLNFTVCSMISWLAVVLCRLYFIVECIINQNLYRKNEGL